MYNMWSLITWKIILWIRFFLNYYLNTLVQEPYTKIKINKYEFRDLNYTLMLIINLIYVIEFGVYESLKWTLFKDWNSQSIVNLSNIICLLNRKIKFVMKTVT